MLSCHITSVLSAEAVNSAAFSNQLSQNLEEVNISVRICQNGWENKVDPENHLDPRAGLPPAALLPCTASPSSSFLQLQPIIILSTDNYDDMIMMMMMIMHGLPLLLLLAIIILSTDNANNGDGTGFSCSCSTADLCQEIFKRSILVFVDRDLKTVRKCNLQIFFRIWRCKRIIS